MARLLELRHRPARSEIVWDTITFEVLTDEK